MLIGRLAMKLAGNQPISMAKKPLNRPRAASENATGKPISMITISPREHDRGEVFHVHGESLPGEVGSGSAVLAQEPLYCTGFS